MVTNVSFSRIVPIDPATSRAAQARAREGTLTVRFAPFSLDNPPVDDEYDDVSVDSGDEKEDEGEDEGVQPQNISSMPSSANEHNDNLVVPEWEASPSKPSRGFEPSSDDDDGEKAAQAAPASFGMSTQPRLSLLATPAYQPFPPYYFSQSRPLTYLERFLGPTAEVHPPQTASLQTREPEHQPNQAQMSQRPSTLGQMAQPQASQGSVARSLAPAADADRSPTPEFGRRPSQARARRPRPSQVFAHHNRMPTGGTSSSQSVAAQTKGSEGQPAQIHHIQAQTQPAHTQPTPAQTRRDNTTGPLQQHPTRMAETQQIHVDRRPPGPRVHAGSRLSQEDMAQLQDDMRAVDVSSLPPPPTRPPFYSSYQATDDDFELYFVSMDARSRAARILAPPPRPGRGGFGIVRRDDDLTLPGTDSGGSTNVLTRDSNNGGATARNDNVSTQRPSTTASDGMPAVSRIDTSDKSRANTDVKGRPPLKRRFGACRDETDEKKNGDDDDDSSSSSDIDFMTYIKTARKRKRTQTMQMTGKNNGKNDSHTTGASNASNEADQTQGSAPDSGATNCTDGVHVVRQGVSALLSTTIKVDQQNEAKKIDERVKDVSAPLGAAQKDADEMKILGNADVDVMMQTIEFRKGGGVAEENQSPASTYQERLRKRSNQNYNEEILGMDTSSDGEQLNTSVADMMDWVATDDNGTYDVTPRAGSSVKSSIKGSKRPNKAHSPKPTKIVNLRIPSKAMRFFAQPGDPSIPIADKNFFCGKAERKDWTGVDQSQRYIIVPLEVRERIYRELLVADGPIRVKSGWSQVFPLQPLKLNIYPKIRYILRDNGKRVKFADHQHYQPTLNLDKHFTDLQCLQLVLEGNRMGGLYALDMNRAICEVIWSGVSLHKLTIDVSPRKIEDEVAEVESFSSRYSALGVLKRVNTKYVQINVFLLQTNAEATKSLRTIIDKRPDIDDQDVFNQMCRQDEVTQKTLSPQERRRRAEQELREKAEAEVNRQLDRLPWRLEHAVNKGAAWVVHRGWFEEFDAGVRPRKTSLAGMCGADNEGDSDYGK